MKQFLLFLSTMFFFSCSSDSEITAQTTMNRIYISIGGQTASVTLVDNSATKALIEKLQQTSVTVTLNSSGGFEIWGSHGFSLPTSNQQMTAHPGDVILYNGNNICLFYGSNSWNYTRLGRIDGLSESELRKFLKAGENDIKVTLSLTNTTGIEDISHTSKRVEDIYSLNGVKVEKPSKGFYIKNGKKVIK